jgi:hypothetical protein
MTQRRSSSLSGSRPLGLLALALVLGLLPAAPVAAQGAPDTEPPRTGLMWLRSELPAVFPLQVKTAPGRSYHLTLSEHATGKPTLAAFIRGGDFFRVLVPPGSYAIRVAHGALWRGEDALFGPGTQVTRLDGPFRFEVQGAGRKAGHLIDLRDLIETREASSRPLAFCQSNRADLTRQPGAPRPDFPDRPDDPLAPDPPLRTKVTTRLCD